MTQVSEAPPEPARLAAVRRTSLLDTPPEEAFDRVTRLAARLLGTPVSLISLVEKDRQFFVSATGLQEPLATTRATPIAYSFCRHVVESGARLVVEDARRHPLVRTNPAVRELGWVAYAGVPSSTATVTCSAPSASSTPCPASGRSAISTCSRTSPRGR